MVVVVMWWVCVLEIIVAPQGRVARVETLRSHKGKTRFVGDVVVLDDLPLYQRILDSVYKIFGFVCL